MSWLDDFGGFIVIGMLVCLAVCIVWAGPKDRETARQTKESILWAGEGEKDRETARQTKEQFHDTYEVIYEDRSMQILCERATGNRIYTKRTPAAWSADGIDIEVVEGGCK